jgi:methyl-accepting chemotaxis protein
MTMQKIAEQVMEINNLIRQISSSASEQASGLKQVNVAVGQMDQVTQQNAAMVEETTAASITLNGEADTLKGLVSRFKVGPRGPKGATGSMSAQNHQATTIPQAPRPVAPTSTHHAPPSTRTNVAAPAPAPRAAPVPLVRGNNAMAAMPSEDDWTEF